MSLAATFLRVLYTLLMLGTSLLSFQSLALSLLYLWHRKKALPVPSQPEKWPPVTVQLPVFNERFVVQPLIDAVCALDYPQEALTIQVLDDSTDETTELGRSRAEHHRARGVAIQWIHRDNRVGFKGGALANGLETARGEFIAVLDADFVPPADFLRRLVPYLTADSELGMVQARWQHLNYQANAITRGQALSLDTHFVVIQTARSRSGLLFNFNGSGGIWRRACIEDAGGWNGNNLTEDLDLSYRAQIKGWRMIYLPEVLVPAQIPPLLSAYRQQQFRWANGGIQTLLESGGKIWRGPLTVWQKVAGTLHLASYLAHPMMLFFILLCLPLTMVPEVRLPSLSWLLPASFGPPLLVLLSQWGMYPDWKKRYAYFPVQIFLSLGMSLNNSQAIFAAVFRRPLVFQRTPKFSPYNEIEPDQRRVYAIPVTWTVWGEFVLGGYTSILAWLAHTRLPELAPVLVLMATSFLFVGLTGLWQGRKHFQKQKERGGQFKEFTGPSAM